MRRNEISLAVVLLFALFMMTGCVISPRRTLGGSATPTPTPTLTGTPTATPTPTPAAPTTRLYVSNQNTNSIAVFSSALSTTGNVAPSATIVGAATTFNGPQYMAFDSAHDRLFVANTGAETVLVFDSASTATANVAPTRTIGGPISGLISPSDVAYDATNDRLYVLDVTDILVYNTISNPAVTGDRAPDRDILVPFNLTAFCLDVVNDRLYATDAATNEVAIFDNVSTLNSPTAAVPASRTLSGALTKLSQPFGVALDPAGNLVVSNSGGGGSITVYTGRICGHRHRRAQRRARGYHCRRRDYAGHAGADHPQSAFCGRRNDCR